MEDALGRWNAWEGEAMIRVGRSTPRLDDERRVARFVWSRLVVGVVLVVAGVTYVAWYLMGPA